MSRWLSLADRETLRKFGARVAALRVAAGKTQGQLADDMCVTQSAVSDIELGRRDIRLTTVIELAHALGAQLSNLLLEEP